MQKAGRPTLQTARFECPAEVHHHVAAAAQRCGSCTRHEDCKPFAVLHDTNQHAQPRLTRNSRAIAHRGADHAHGVVDGEPLALCGHRLAVSARAAAAVEVDVHRLRRVLLAKPEDLRDDELAHRGHDRHANKDDTVVEGQGGEVGRWRHTGAATAAARLDGGPAAAVARHHLVEEGQVVWGRVDVGVCRGAAGSGIGVWVRVCHGEVQTAACTHARVTRAGDEYW